MLQYVENKNHGYTSRLYMSVLEDGPLPIYQPGQLFQQDNAQIHTTEKTEECHENYGIV